MDILICGIIAIFVFALATKMAKTLKYIISLTSTRKHFVCIYIVAIKLFTKFRLTKLRQLKMVMMG